MELHKLTNNSHKNIDQKFIAENLSALLKQRNLNVNQLAQLIGIPMMTIRRLLSGETEDPRISTLKLIANYFNISIDSLINGASHNKILGSKGIKSYLIPKFTWVSLSRLNKTEILDINEWEEWESISLSEPHILSNESFALESRPSMYARFPKGTIFIIDPQALPTDGDIVLIKIKQNNEFTLKELIVDPPSWRLSSLVTDSSTIDFSEEDHEIVGVSLLTMLYNPKFNN